ncbi:uncharacterized protein LOC108742438 isoform X2 [Agrilus planipennis]|uniref:Uncharacterized protein LOC108742438 isoform X2 n=1 Tax=Agrilus planipennis TaxID=224129 RepID=A0A7F5RNP8_AGRPL|nr:uncharacterized protein LOC108742438 isoform X2 [Agrilus planipennis]
MFGNKLRSWMEAVRPKKKQQRKEKNSKNGYPNASAVYVTHIDTVCNSRFPENENTVQDVAVRKTIIGSECRYSGTNLSSPESAYSTGYSTDGTSPGAPPEYYVNIRTGTKYFRDGESCPGYRLINNNAQTNGNCTVVKKEQLPMSPYPSSSKINKKDDENNLPLHKGIPTPISSPPSTRLPETIVTSSIMSPRQRNRIRTNPWLPGNSLSPGASSITLHSSRQEPFTSPLLNNSSNPRIMAFQNQKNPSKHGTSVQGESLSSSSCSSLSDENNPWDSNLLQMNPRLDMESDEDDEEDCTLNEMMGKYDESYVYEKETDILSDSDPTDCETDIDTGQDGGDEGEATEREFDFIDNGSLKEFGHLDKEIKNTGHCVYFNYEGHIRQSSRRRTTRRSQKTDSKNSNFEKRKRSNSFKKRPRHPEPIHNRPDTEQRAVKNGSRSAGTTPISIRKTKRLTTKYLQEEQQKKRSNSVSYTETISLIDKRDIEAEKKYKELIVEAEHILMTMKTNGISPRRLPTPTNKRVEMLRNGESPIKSDGYLRNRLIEDTANLHLSNIPSNVFNNTVCSPKKVNFASSNSRHLMKREIEIRHSPLEMANYQQNTIVKKKLLSPKLSRKSPKFRKKNSKSLTVRRGSSSSDDENEKRPKRNHVLSRKDFVCPQSEPVKRKNYFTDNKIFVHYNYKEGQLNPDLNKPYICNRSGLDVNNSGENLRQQVLLNTIANLKRSLEDQSASLKQVCRSSQNINV